MDRDRRFLERGTGTRGSITDTSGGKGEGVLGKPPIAIPGVDAIVAVLQRKRARMRLRPVPVSVWWTAFNLRIYAPRHLPHGSWTTVSRR